MAPSPFEFRDKGSSVIEVYDTRRVPNGFLGSFRQSGKDQFEIVSSRANIAFTGIRFPNKRSVAAFLNNALTGEERIARARVAADARIANAELRAEARTKIQQIRNASAGGRASTERKSKRRVGPASYADLGLRPVINAAATLTRLGGSLMPPEVVEAMSRAAGSFVDLHELQRRVGERIARQTHNEAAYVSSGAAAGILLAVAACIAGTDPERIAAFPTLDGLTRREVIIQRSQRNGYDYAARQTGARLIEISGAAAELESAISERTAAILWFAGANFARDALAIEQVVEIARPRGVPVLVDAAAQIPPIATLWRFTRDLSADAVIISGGKGLRGPQSSGLVLGRREIIEGCRANGAPNHAIGRPMKVGKEELLGLLAAVEWSLAQDEPAVIAGYEAIVQRWIEGLADIPGVTAERGYPSEAGQPHARAIVRLMAPCPLTRNQVVDVLWNSNPRIAVGTVDFDAIALNPQTLQPGEEAIVLEALRGLLNRGPQ